MGLELIMLVANIKSKIKIDDNLYAVMIEGSHGSTLSKIKATLVTINEDRDYTKTIKSNVAIAAAVTSYSRIHMIPFKLDDSICYTRYRDTHSIFTTKPLPDHMISKELGLMKDELGGCVIDEAYFLGNKKYGYTYKNKEGKIINSSVFSGVERDSLSFEEVTFIAKGGTIVKDLQDRFNRSIKNLSITIKHATISVTKSDFKKLNKNTYIPI